MSRTDGLNRAQGASAASRKGAVLGLLAAALFGVSAPVSKCLLAEVSPQVLAGLLYLGAGIGLALYRTVRPSNAEARLRRSDAGTLAAIIALGGAIGPVLMLLGLRRMSAVAGSLLLNLEAPLTILVALIVFREHLGKRELLSVALILSAAVVLGVAPGPLGADLLGTLSIAGACLCWALDNNLTQRLTLRDPLAIVRLKALSAGALNLAIGVGLGGGFPVLRVVSVALVLGTLSYGLSVLLDAYALRLLGAAREAAYFATGPFIGAIASTVVVGERIHGLDALSMGVMALGVLILVRERHGHLHTHEDLEHDHVHAHDEHHQHEHGADDPPGEPHAHAHMHAPLAHDHAHVSDLHHRHEH
jgi:drug/metabolite transporter (DMT)-like permease